MEKFFNISGFSYFQPRKHEKHESYFLCPSWLNILKPRNHESTKFLTKGNGNKNRNSLQTRKCEKSRGNLWNSEEMKSPSSVRGEATIRLVVKITKIKHLFVKSQSIIFNNEWHEFSNRRMFAAIECPNLRTNIKNIHIIRLFAIFVVILQIYFFCGV